MKKSDMRDLRVSARQRQEAKRQARALGTSFFSLHNSYLPRQSQPLLGCSQWRRFEEAINRAMISCGQSGNNPDYHFAGAGKMIETGKGAVSMKP